MGPGDASAASNPPPAAFFAPGGGKHARTIHGDRFLDFLDLFGLKPNKHLGEVAAFAACRIRAAAAGDAWLLAGSSAMAQVWINGAEVLHERTEHGLETYNASLRIRLNRGTNLLVAKVTRRFTTWGLAARLDLSEDDAIDDALDGQDTVNAILLESPVVLRGDPLRLSVRGVPAEAALGFEVSDLAGAVEARFQARSSGPAWKPGGDLSDGIYRLSVRRGSRTFAEAFCLGEPETVATALLKGARTLPTGRWNREDLAAVERRVGALVRSGAAGNVPAWRYRTVSALADLAEAVRRANLGADPFKDVPGLHLRGFVSKIDAVHQDYRLFVPGAYDRSRGALPLVVMCPSVVSANRPFVESAFLWDQADADRLCALAERHGVGLLWCGYRCRPTGAPCDFAHVDEVLEAVGKDYRVDARRITLLASCGGAAFATKLAAARPGRFAAVGVLDPVFDLRKDMDDCDEFAPFRDYQAWAADTSVLPWLARLKGPEIAVAFDGSTPGHGTLEDSLSFVRRATAASYPVTFSRRARDTAMHFGAWNDLFAFLSSRRLGDSPPDKAPSFPEGAVERFLAGPFVLVEGSGGGEADRAWVERMTRQFERTWKSVHFGPCPAVWDRQAGRTTLAGRKPVLIGTPETNLFWRSLRSSIPVRVDSDSIRMGSATWLGRHLILIAALSDGARGDPGVLVITSVSPATQWVPPLRLSTCGWYRYAVWDPDQPAGCRLVDAADR